MAVNPEGPNTESKVQSSDVFSPARFVLHLTKIAAFERFILGDACAVRIATRRPIRTLRSRQVRTRHEHVIRLGSGSTQS